MNSIKKIAYVIRKIYNLPFLILITIGNFYSKFIKIFDKRNYDTFWEEVLQKNVDKKISKTILIPEVKKEIRFYTPTKISAYRAKTFFTKEPETLEWMSSRGSHTKVLYDVGANMGIYTIYYAKMFQSKVYAFEPSYRNLDLLAKNVNLNLLNENVSIISNPISKKFIFSNFFQLRSIAGDAGATFDDNQIEKEILEKDKHFHPDAKNNTAQYNTLGLSIDSLRQIDLIKSPDLIKIDVDGNELDVIYGCEKTIKNSKSISILIETRKSTENIMNKKLKELGLKKISQAQDNAIWEK